MPIQYPSGIIKVSSSVSRQAMSVLLIQLYIVRVAHI